MGIVRPITRPVTRPVVSYPTRMSDEARIAANALVVPDYSDLTSLYVGRDGSGGHPAPGDPIGLILNKSGMGGKTAAEYIASRPELYDHDASFLYAATGTKTASGWNITATGPSAQVSSAGNIFIEGETYVMSVAWSGNDEGRTIRPWINGTQTAGSAAASGSETVVLKAGSDAAGRAALYVPGSASGETFYLEITSIKHIPNEHIIAPADNQRATLRKWPVTGKRNLFPYSEDVTNWTGQSGVTVTPGYPDRVSTTGGTLPSQTLEVEANTTYRIRSKVGYVDNQWLRLRMSKDAGGSDSAWFDLTGLTVGTVSAGMSDAEITQAEDGAIDIEVTWTSGAADAGSRSLGLIPIAADNSGTAGSGDLDIYRVQLEPGSTATPYQKVINEDWIEEAGVPAVYSPSYDGVDDGLAYTFPGGVGPSDCSVFFAMRTADNKFVPFATEDDYFFLATDSASSDTWVSHSAVRGPNYGYRIDAKAFVFSDRADVYSQIADNRWLIGEAHGLDLSSASLLGVSNYSWASWKFEGQLIGPIIVETSKLTNSLRRTIETYLKRQAGIQ